MESLLTALRAAGEQTRLRLLAVLAHGELTVKELTNVLGQSQPRISRHLKLMTESGLIVRYPEGSWVFYRIAETGQSAKLARDLIALMPQDDPVLIRDFERLAGVRAQRAQIAQNYFSKNAANWGQLRALHISEETIENEMRALMDQPHYETLVDLGTGTGRMLEVFGGLAARGIGFDTNADMLSLARANLDQADLPHCQVRLGDIGNLPLPHEEADLVIMHQVLHFLEDPAAVIREAARILKPDGKLIIVDFAPHHIEQLRDEHAHRRLGFTDNEITQYFQETGIAPQKPILLQNKNTEPSEGLSVYIWSGHKQAQGAQNYLEVPFQNKIRDQQK